MSITSLQAQRRIFGISYQTRTLRYCAMILPFLYISRWTKSTTWPARLVLSITSMTRFRLLRPAYMALSICSVWPSGSRQKYFRPQPVKSMGTRRCIRNQKANGEMSIPLVFGPAMMRASGVPRRSFLTTIVSTNCALRWPGYSIPTARACIPMTAGW